MKRSIQWCFISAITSRKVNIGQIVFLSYFFILMPYTRSDIQKLVAHPVANRYIRRHRNTMHFYRSTNNTEHLIHKKRRNTKKVCFFHCRRNLLIRQCFILYALVAWNIEDINANTYRLSLAGVLIKYRKAPDHQSRRLNGSAVIADPGIIIYSHT